MGNVYVFFSSYHYFHLLLKTFLVPTNSFKQDILQCHDAHVFMVILFIFLAFGSIFARYLAKVQLVSLKNHSCDEEIVAHLTQKKFKKFMLGEQELKIGCR